MCCCPTLVQVILFLASGFDAVVLIGLIPGLDDAQMKGLIVQIVSCISLLLAFGKLIGKESCVLCCKYYCIPYSLCCCNNKQIKSANNVRGFWISYSGIYFDLINAYLLLNGHEETDTDYIVIAGTAIGAGQELLELISELAGCFYIGSIQLIVALVEAIIGIVQLVIVLMNGGSNSGSSTPSPTSTTTSAPTTGLGIDLAVYFSIYMYCIIVFAVFYAFCQINKAKKQEKVRRSTAGSVQLAVKT